MVTTKYLKVILKTNKKLNPIQIQQIIEIREQSEGKKLAGGGMLRRGTYLGICH